ncbi:hypothetical protein ACEF06_23720 [Brevibacillus agri]
MQAGRELDVKVAEALGWIRKEHPVHKVDVWVLREYDGQIMDYLRNDEFQPSTSWESMGVLVANARDQGIQIDILPRHNGYVVIWGKRWADNLVCLDAPHGVCLGFLKAKGIPV